MRNLKQLRASTALRAMAFAIPLAVLAFPVTPAAAQTPPEKPAASSASDSATTSQSPSLGDIVVTAQRREENVQKVPVSVTAISGAALTQRAIVDSTDITKLVPALKFNAYSPSTTVYNLRGVSQNDYSDHLEPPVAVYLDDAYVSSMAAAGFPLFDIDRVEALRGPQGTLFGRNATGGAIQFISRKPTNHFSLNSTATWFSDGGYSFEAGIGGPVSDTLSVRAAIDRVKRDGYVKDTIVRDHGETDVVAGRVQLLWKPTPDVKLLLSARRSRDDDSSAGGTYSYKQAVPGAHNLGVYQGAGEDFWGTGPGHDAGGYQKPAGLDDYTIESNTPSIFSRTLQGYTGRLDWSLGKVNFIAITDYQRMNKFYQEDCDASPVTVCVFAPGSKTKQFSQEIRLEGISGPVQWVGGFYYIDIDGNYRSHAEYNLPAIGYFFTGDSAYRIHTTSPSVFAQGEIALTDTLKATLGGRYTRDHKRDIYQLNAHTVFGGAPTDEIVQFNPSLNPSQANRTFNLYSAKAQLNYSPSNDLLIYAGVTRGTKSGNFSAPVTTPVIIANLPHDPEVLYDYEAGIKSKLFDNRLRLNGAVFYYDYKHYQAFNLQNLVQTIANRNAWVYGGELEATAAPVNGLTLSAGLSYLKTKVKDVSLPDGTVVDRQMPQAPHFSGNASIAYTVPVSEGALTARLDGTYSSKFCFSVVCAPVEREGSYTTLDASLSYEFGDVTLIGFVKNATGVKYRIYGLDVSALGVMNSVLNRPRYYGLTLAVSIN